MYRRPAVVTNQIIGASLSFFTSDEIRSLSVKEITNPTSFPRVEKGEPIPEGPHDLALGSTEREFAYVIFFQIHFSLYLMTFQVCNLPSR